MSQVETLKQGYEAFGRGDIDAAFANFADDCVFRGTSDLIPAGGTYHGMDEIRGRWLQEFGATWEDFRMSTDEFLESGNTIVTLGTARGRLRGTDEEIKAPFAHVWRYNDEGKVVEASFFGDSARVFQAIQQRDEASATA